MGNGHLFVVAIFTLLVTGCTEGSPTSPASVPSAPSPAPTPAPLPAPPPPTLPQPFTTSVRTFEVGQTVTVPWLGFYDRSPMFKVTAPVTGILAVQLKWHESQWDVGWYTLTYGNTVVGSDFHAALKIQVIAGQTYEFIVTNTWPWDVDPGFVLTSWIE